jgi:hypothetical protein
LGTDELGREVLSFISGHVAWEPAQPPSVTSEASLARVAGLVREFHDLTAGTPLAAEVVCHNDLSPKNTVYRDHGTGLAPVAFIDWDLAGAGRRMRLICDAYGLPDRGSLLPAIVWWQDRCWRGIEAKAASGDPAMTRLRDSGAARSVRDAYDWVTSHRAELATYLR